MTQNATVAAVYVCPLAVDGNLALNAGFYSPLMPLKIIRISH